MTKTYQYKWIPITQTALNNFVGQGVTLLSVSDFYSNIECDETLKGDLDAYMSQLGFQYIGEIVP